MLIDTTLREGEQLYGAYFDTATRRGIIRSLVAAGIEEIEIGCVGHDWIEELLPWAESLIAKTGARTTLSLWCRLKEEDLVKAAELGAKRVNLGAPVSGEHLEKRLGLSGRGLFSRLERVLNRARALGFEYVSVSLEDVSRAEPNFAAEAARLAVSRGAGRIRLSDTVGLLSPPEMIDLVRMFRLCARVPIAVHCHNDFGMATANAVSALDAGASMADASVLGIGERSGIAAIEELAAYLRVRRGRNYDLAALANLARLVAKAARMEIPRNKAVAGRDIFACETGLHVQALMREPALFEPYAPELVGAARMMAGGGKSGRGALRELFARLGREVKEQELDGLARAVRGKSRTLGRPLTENELRDLASNIPPPERAGGNMAA